MVASSKTEPRDPAYASNFSQNKNHVGRRFVHVLLAIYGIVLSYVVGGLLFKYYVNPDVFFGLSFALLSFALGQSIYELGANRALLFFLITTIVGFGVEVLGTNTGLPFGKYSYGDFLGEKVFGVPVVVPLVWFVISYITFSITFSSRSPPTAGSTLSYRAKIKLALPLIILASFGAVAWDFMVDPMFSTYHYWTWQTSSSTPSLSGVPLSNFLGWFVVAFLMLFIFVSLSRTRRSSLSFFCLLRRTGNTLDSRIAYVLLMIDAAVANAALEHYLAVVIGVITMSAFLFLTTIKLNVAYKPAAGNRQRETISQN